jgi:adenosine deaminase
MEKQKALLIAVTEIISETNGISLIDTLDLLISSDLPSKSKEAYDLVLEFREMIDQFRINRLSIQALLEHPVSKALFEFFRIVPLKYREEHTHLTGAVTAEFVYPRLMKLLSGPHREIYERKIAAVYGPGALPIKTLEDVDRLMRLKEDEGFSRYLDILYLPQLVFISREAHMAAAEHIARELYYKYNVGFVRLKFSLSRASSSSTEQIPGFEEVTPEDVVLGLYEGFESFKKTHSDFQYVLSPSFRKEAHRFNSAKFKNREEDFLAQINDILGLIDRNPQLEKVLCDVDTVGDEKELYRKEHFNELQVGFRKLQYRGFNIRSHHGETFHTLKKGIQAVDNAMNIWHIDTLEHGVSLGINPNFYFHRLYQEVFKKNEQGEKIAERDFYHRELVELDWGNYAPVLQKLLKGERLTDSDHVNLIKAKFHTAREVEHYQHDVLNRLIDKGVALVSLPSSNKKLTGQFEDYKDHPFSWWEKKGVNLGIGTDNYVTLNTNFIQELLILLYTDPEDLKITKLLMVATGESRRPFISHHLWKMRKRVLYGT